jgi:signal transduction histidine kinase/ActR/RegA family two-component response regulator
VIELDVTVFQLDRGRAALEKYAILNHLTVEVYGADGRVVAGAVHRTPLFDLFARGNGPEMMAGCARRCLSQPDANPAVVMEEQYGMAVVGIPLLLAGVIVGAAVAGYALTTHLSYREVERLARACRLPFDDVWAVTRKELPVPRGLLPLRGELLGIIGNTLLSEDHRSRELEATSMRLAEAAETKDKFLAVLSHELRTPLTAILGYATLIRRRKLDEAAMARALEVIERNAMLQTQLIDDLLDVSRIISGSLRVDLQPVALAPIIEAAIASARPLLTAKDLCLELAIDPAASLVSGDGRRLQQIVSNLLVNATKFTPIGGTITVRLQQRPGEVCVVVNDTGMGIRSEFLPYVFERFRQADVSNSRAHGGLGLGLAIVQHLVGLHDGSVCAESDGLGHGATFIVSLPALIDAEAWVAPANGGSSSHATDATLRGVRVLVIDDDVDALDLFTRVLEMAHAKVTAVSSAQAALLTLPTWKPHVLVSDIGMPDEDGYALIRKIRRRPPELGGNVPALAVTAYASVDDIKLALAAGFDAHRSKPIGPAELIVAVSELARGVVSAEG